MKEMIQSSTNIPENLSSWNDEQLMVHFSACNKDGFDVLYRRYKGRLYNYIFLICRNSNDVEDVYQDTFVRIFTNKTKYNGVNKFSTWAYKIAQRLSLNHIRKSRRFTDSGLYDSKHEDGSNETHHQRELPDSATPIDENLVKAEWEAKIERALASLPPEKHEVVMLRVEGFSYQEIAEVLKMSNAGARKIFQRAIEAIRKKCGL